MPKYKIYQEQEYKLWYEGQTFKSKRQILDRLSKIEESEYFGHVRNLDENEDGLQEIKFNDGRRIYYIIIPVANVILLLGGNNNGQDKDIKKSRAILAKAKNRAAIRGL